MATMIQAGERNKAVRQGCIFCGLRVESFGSVVVEMLKWRKEKTVGVRREQGGKAGLQHDFG